MQCLDDKAVTEWVNGSARDNADVIREHIDHCETCRELVTSVVMSQWIGQTVGRYRIVELIGGGAMGEVYRAEDPALGRVVAIKLVRAGGSERRLLREAQAMARLAHPNVIRVYDVGTLGEDKVFLAMELVQGSTLRAWFRESRSWRSVVDVMRDAGRGLLAAHEAGIVHGDFKPDNVLVDGERVLVTDFGLAAEAPGEGPVTDISIAQTVTGGIAGTPAYMAPEQLGDGRGQASQVASPASDQFSFCVTLYEGLCGTRPFPGNDLASLRASVASGRLEIPAHVPRTIARVLRRGLAVRAGERYASMAELLGELDAASKRRTRWIALSAAAAGAVIATTAWVASDRGPACDGASELASVWNAKARGRITTPFVAAGIERYAEAWIATYEATCKAPQSEALLDIRMTCLSRRKQDLRALVDALAVKTPSDIVDATAMLAPVSDCADAASLQDVERLAPALRERVAGVERELARCRALLATGQYKPAQDCASAAAKTSTYGPILAESELVAGIAATRLRTWPDADAALTRALFAAESSRDARTRAQVLSWLVAVGAERGAFAQAHERSEHAAAVIKGLGEDKQLAAELAFHSGVLALRESKLDAAQTALARSITLREELHGANDARIAEPLGALATVHTMRKQYDEAGRAIDRALAIQTAALGASHPAIGKTLHAKAQLEMRTGKHEAALASQARSYELLVAAYGENHRDVALSVGLIAQANIFAGKYAEALPPARRSLELMENAAGADHLDTAVALQTLAAALNRAGDEDGALAANRRVLAIREKALGPDHLWTTQTQVSIAMSLRTKSRCADALPLLEAALEARSKLFPKDHPEVLRVKLTLGDCHVDLGKAEAALAYLEPVLAGFEAAQNRSVDDRVNRASARYSLARALWEADRDRERAVSLARAARDEFVELKDKRAESMETWAKNRKVKL